MTLQTEGIGYKDLDELFSKPCDLEFIMEIVSIERPEEYERETWQLNEDERRAAIQKYRDLGNEFYRNKQIAEAEAKYEAALGIVEQLLTKYVFFLLDPLVLYYKLILLCYWFSGKSRMTLNGQS